MLLCNAEKRTSGAWMLFQSSSLSLSGLFDVDFLVYFAEILVTQIVNRQWKN